MAAVAVLAFGLAPRAYVVAWVVFGSTAAIGLLGPGLRMPQWMLDLSPLTHVGDPPSGGIDAVTLAALALVALAVATTGFAGFRRRRVPSA